MKVVLDASAGVSAVMDETSIAMPILRKASAVLAPRHYVVEVTSGLWKYVMWRGLPIDVAAGHLALAVRLVNKYRNVAAFAEEALREASARRHSVYDLYYAVLARRENAALLTFDGRLRELCAKMRIPLADA